MSKLLVLPGTIWQVSLIRKIRQMGHEAVVFNPMRNAGVYELADSYLDSDIFDVDRIECFARRSGVDGVITDECDIAMPVVAELGARLGLSTLSREAAALYTNKAMMREFGGKVWGRAFDYRLCENASEAVEFLGALGRPIMLKPLDCNASHGVFKARTERDIRSHFDEALSFSRSRKAVLAECYVSGPEFTVDGVKTPRGHYTLAISEKKHYEHNRSIANELVFTHTNERYDYDKLKETNDRFVESSPLEFGLTHAEYKYADGDFHLIEIGARGGGNMISSMIAPFMSGCDTYEYLIRCSLGDVKSLSFELDKSCLRRAAALKFFCAPQGGGIVKDVLGLQSLEQEDIAAFALNFHRGDSIANPTSDSDRIGYYIVCSPNVEKMNDVMLLVEDNFGIVT